MNEETINLACKYAMQGKTVFVTKHKRRHPTFPQ